jgi:diaminopropionate ammonia-lyase
MAYWVNSLPEHGRPLSDSDREAFGKEAPSIVRPYLHLWPPYPHTPLHSLACAAAVANVASIHLKDEGQRLGLGSFKALGGAYAVFSLLREIVQSHMCRSVSIDELMGDDARRITRTLTVSCATDGNHGRSVAAGARIVGCRSVIFVHSGVSEARIAAIGADEIVCVRGSYDDSVDEAVRVCEREGWHLVSDTSWPGYERIPIKVGQAYTIVAEEALEAMHRTGIDSPTHVLLQAGVGGFAAAISAYLRDFLGTDAPHIVVVEPEHAACLFESARRGDLIRIPASRPTIMSMLECYQPSLVAWRILKSTADGFLTISDESAAAAVHRLANPYGRDPVVTAAESGAASLAGLFAICSDAKIRDAVGLDERSRVLVVNTETATAPHSDSDRECPCARSTSVGLV